MFCLNTKSVPFYLQKNVWNKYVRPEGGKTVGSMDLGGASTQIAFAVADNFTGTDYLRVKLYGYPYNVYTHSFLCYGKNEAEKKVLDKIVQVLQSRKHTVCVPYNVQGLLCRSKSIKASELISEQCYGLRRGNKDK